MKTRMIILTMLASLVFGMFGGVALPSEAVYAQGSPTAVPITGTFTDAVGGLGTIEGIFDITRFAVQNGALVAIGDFTGTLTDSLGNVLEVDQQITLPVAQQQSSGTCEILNLVLGPLDLDLLGLVVHLDQVVLTIDAEAGGGLLGDLLCAVANLLNGSAPLNPLVRLLNNILRILG